MAAKLAKEVEAAMEALAEAEKRYQAAKQAYRLDRIRRIQGGESVEPSVLTGDDLEQQRRAERVAIHNRGVDDETQRARERGLLP
jgi:hypothetical protein